MLYPQCVLVLLCSIILAKKMETGCHPVTCGAAEGWPLDLPVNGSPLADGKKKTNDRIIYRETNYHVQYHHKLYPIRCRIIMIK